MVSWDTSAADYTKGEFARGAAEARSPWVDSAREARQWDTSIADETKGNFAESAAEARSSWGDDNDTGYDTGSGYDFGAGQGGMFNASFDDGGYVDEDIEGQGSDDAMFDPMQYIQGALDYGKQKYGIPTSGGGEMSFDDGGVVPTEPDPETAAQGNPNAIDPRQAMAYLSGDGAVSPEIAQALEQRIDPQGQMNPTQRAMAAIGVAPDDEARFGLIQHYRTKYNGFSAAAKAALAKGDMGEAAQQATKAMDSVPNGERTQFAPAANGLAMLSRPAFGRGGGKPAQQPRQQSFEDGGEVEEDADEDNPDVFDAGVQPGVAEQLYPGPEEDGVVTPVGQQENPLSLPSLPPPDYSDRKTDEPTMPDVPPAPAAPQVMPVPEIVKMLDKGFDAQLENAPSRHLGSETRLVDPPTRFAGEIDPALEPLDAQLEAARETQRGQAFSGMPAPAADASESGVLRAWRAAGPPPPPVENRIAPAGGPITQLAEKIHGSVLPSVNEPPAPTTGSEAATRPPEYPAPAAPAATAPVTPARRPTASAAPPPGAVIDEDRWNPFTRTMRPAAPGTFGTSEAARRAGTVVPMTEEAAGASAAGPVRRTNGAAGPARPAGVVPTREEPLGDATMRKVVRGSLGTNEVGALPPPRNNDTQTERNIRQNAKYRDFMNTTGVVDVQTRPGSTPRDFLHRRGAPTTDPEELRLEAAQRQAAAIHPWVGRDADKRAAETAAIMKRGDEYRKAVDVEELRGDKARDVAATTVDKQRVANEGLLAKQEAIREANIERDRLKAGEKMKVEAFKQNFRAVIESDKTRAGILREMMRGKPDLITDPFKAEQVLGPRMQSMGLDPKQAMSVARMLEGFDPNTGEYVGPDAAMIPTRGGVVPTSGSGPPSSIDAAAARNLRPGAEGSMTHNGKTYKYIVGPDGRWYDEGEYKKRFGR